MDEREFTRTLLRGVYCGKCGREARIGPCVCSPPAKPNPVKVEDLDAVIRERLDDGRDGDAVRAVLDFHPYAPTGIVDGWILAVCNGCNVAYPCREVAVIARALGIEVADA